MKIAAAILIVLLSFLLVQPVSGMVEKQAQAGSCSMKKSSCDKQKENSDQDRNCESDRCNPFMSCTTGNFFDLENYAISSDPAITEAKKLFLENDNRLRSRCSECWHPPENA